MLKYLAAFFLIFASVVSSQTSPFNTVLKGTLNPRPNFDYNDIWGYVDSDGREYALMGAYQGTAIIEVTNPASPRLVTFITGPNSTWRDIKTHQHYAYITTEGTGSGTGLQIVDLSGLPNTASLVNTVSTWFTNAHNIYIDNGYAYVIGTGGGGGLHILDLANPAAPVRKSYFTQTGYIHDIYVYNDTAYSSSENTYDIINVTNKSNPVLVSSSAALPSIYAHSGWLSEDKRYFIACEEFNQRDITIWDLQDRNSWNLIVPSWKMPGNSPVHNVFVKGDYAHISYYKDGYVVIDISDPSNPTLAGWYDTYPLTTGTYEGAWGVYPYLPSGNILVSDINSGLYIIDFTLDNTTPVELTSFTASPSGGKIQLSWVTATELNNSHFEIERSANRNEWVKIGEVRGNITTASPSEYSFLDESPLSGKQYYRLKQIDLDGTFEYSNIIETENAGPENFLIQQNYPNPFNPSTTINVLVNESKTVTLEVFDVLGNLTETLFSGTLESGTHSFRFSGASLPSGMYFARLSDGSTTQIIKMLLMK